MPKARSLLTHSGCWFWCVTRLTVAFNYTRVTVDRFMEQERNREPEVVLSRAVCSYNWILCTLIWPQVSHSVSGSSSSSMQFTKRPGHRPKKWRCGSFAEFIQSKIICILSITFACRSFTKMNSISASIPIFYSTTIHGCWTNCDDKKWLVISTLYLLSSCFC